VLWRSGILGKGTLFRYPPSWVPTEIDSFLWSVAADVDGNTMENGRPVVLPKGLLRRSRIPHFGGDKDDAADIDHDVVPR